MNRLPGFQSPPWWQCIVGGILAVLSVTCEPQTQDPRVRDLRGYDIKDSGYIGRNSSRDVFWLDNDRIMFIGTKPGDFIERTDGLKFPAYHLYVWNTRNSTVRLHHKGSLYSGLCVYQNYIRFGFEDQGEQYELAGEYGKEEKTQITKEIREARRTSQRMRNPYTCLDYLPAELPKLGFRVVPLLDGDFFSVDREPRPWEVVHGKYWPSGGKPVLLDMGPEAIGPQRYYEFIESYVLVEGPRHAVASDTAIRRHWLMDRSGKMRDFTPPTGPWMAGSIRVAPTKRGLFLLSHESSNRFGGGYLMLNGALARVIAGSPESYDISPDGCRVALSIADWTARGQIIVRRIKMLDLCAKGG